MEVRDSRGLVISQSLLHAGKGAPGTDGVEGPVNARTDSSNGAPARDQMSRTCNAQIVLDCNQLSVPGSAGGVTTCMIGPPGGPGGKGGDGRWFANGADANVPAEFRGLPLVATPATAVGGLNNYADGTGKGLPGARGASGAAGPDGTNGTWTLTALGFGRGNGTAGGPGQPGQGGGGGAGAARYFVGSEGGVGSPVGGSPYWSTATGGGGAGGGCGGQAGAPATGGGASIGMLALKSAISIERTRIESSEGGRAGKGNLGTSGITGGTGGAGTVHGVATTGKGGDGGAGGNGGASGHGAPGPSIALAYTEKPTMTEAKLAPGRPGEGQPELKQLIAPDVYRTLPGVIGVSKEEHVIRP
jgi:hypothetical protein